MSLLERRRAMMQQTVGLPTYTSPENLVLWLDGYEKGGVSDRWIDLVDGKEFVFNNTEHCRNLRDGVEFDGQGWAECPNDNISYPSTTHTIEYVITPYAYGSLVNSFAVFTTGRISQVVGLMTFENSRYRLYNQSAGDGNANAWEYGNITLIPQIAQINKQLGCWNGHRSSTITPSNITQSAKNSAYIAKYFGSSWEQCLNGKIHAIRVYNKILTEQEMIFNATIDNVRFNLGLTI